LSHELQPRLLILCIGNLLMLDEGLGPQVAAELLARYELPDNVEVLDRGVMGMALLADLRRADAVLVVDALDNTGYLPGTVCAFAPDDLAYDAGPKGAHDMRIADVLAAAALLGVQPQVDCLGVQVKDMNPKDYQIGLTPEVEAALPAVIEYVEKWIYRRGIVLITKDTI
jgi:hydrogenase maturation protease